MKNESLPLVSAVITTHNRKELLKKSIDSVLNQSYSPIECIVVDDASTDNTMDYLEEYIQSGSIKYVYIDKDDSKGGNHARNIGIIESTGDYIAFLDDDDEWMNTKIEQQMHLVSKDVGFVYTGRVIEKNFKSLFDESIGKEFQEGNLSKEILIHILTVTSTILVSRKLLIDVGFFDENLKFWQEYDLCIRLLQLTEVRCVKQGLVLYRVINNDKNRLSNNIAGWEESVKYIDNKYSNLISHLSRSEQSRRKLYICIDGYNRGKSSKSFTYILKYAVFYPILHPGVIRAFIIKSMNVISRRIR